MKTLSKTVARKNVIEAIEDFISSCTFDKLATELTGLAEELHTAARALNKTAEWCALTTAAGMKNEMGSAMRQYQRIGRERLQS